MAAAKTSCFDVSRKPRRKIPKNVIRGYAYTRLMLNSTIASFIDMTGAVIAWASSGQVGLKGLRKSTSFAAQLAAGAAVRRAQERGMKKVDVFIKGPDSGCEAAIRSLQTAGLEVGSIQDVAPQARDGARPPERRRV